MQFATAIVEKLRERAARFEELTEQLSQPEVAQDGKRSSGLARERGQLESAARLAERIAEFEARREEAQTILGEEQVDPEFAELARDDLVALEQEFPALDREAKAELVTDEDDHLRKIIVELRAGAGGDEASLFAADLYRMYSKFIETRRWKTELLDATPTEVGGFKEITFAVEGDDAWRLLRWETGGHRVQRVPATETQGRIHTSAATVAVLPEPEAVDVNLKDEDLRIDTMRSSGPGGQSVNKTSSAVRITHLPTNTVVICQDEKSQHKNKAKAMRILRSRLFEAERQKRHAERAELRKSQVGTGDRSDRVRTYNYPQNRVSDHRLGENYSLEKIVAGQLAPVFEALVERDREDRIRNL